MASSIIFEFNQASWKKHIQTIMDTSINLDFNRVHQIRDYLLAKNYQDEYFNRFVTSLPDQHSVASVYIDCKFEITRALRDLDRLDYPHWNPNEVTTYKEFLKTDIDEISRMMDKEALSHLFSLIAFKSCCDPRFNLSNKMSDFEKYIGEVRSWVIDETNINGNRIVEIADFITRQELSDYTYERFQHIIDNKFTKSEKYKILKKVIEAEINVLRNSEIKIWSIFEISTIREFLNRDPTEFINSKNDDLEILFLAIYSFSESFSPLLISYKEGDKTRYELRNPVYDNNINYIKMDEYEFWNVHEY